MVRIHHPPRAEGVVQADGPFLVPSEPLPGTVPSVTAVLRRPSGYLLALLAIYAGLTILTLVVWSARGVYGFTGDEPHYLVIANALLHHGTFDVSGAYADEFASRAIFAAGLADPGTIPAAPFAHVVVSDTGMFSWHGPGVSFLVALPFALLGTTGAKLAMAVLGALIVIVTWRVSESFSSDVRARFASTAVVCLAYPLIPASTQIYPDLLAGLLALSVVYLLLTLERQRSKWSIAGYSALIGFLPWLGQKFTLPAAILGVGAFVMLWRSSHRREWPWLLGPALVIVALYLVFNVVAFGSLAGSPSEGALKLTATALMAAYGLLADQDQGFLMQNPVLWLGVAGLLGFARRHLAVFIVWALTFAAIWVPGALHPGLYGLGSFVGRYSWALAVLFVVPTLLTLAWLAQHARRWFRLVIAAAAIINTVFFVWATLGSGMPPGSPAGFDLYTKSPDTWLESYALFYFPLQNWVPALYNVDWAFTFWPNLAWLVLLIALLGAARWRAARWVAFAAVVAVIAAGAIAVPGPRTSVADVRQTSASAGYLSGVPIRQMRMGTYRWTVRYSAAAATTTAAGKWELVRSATAEVVAAGELAGTDGATIDSGIALPYLSLRPVEYYLRVAAYGQGPLTVESTSVTHE